VERHYRVNRVMHDLAGPNAVAVAVYLVDKLCEPERYYPRLWLGMEPLQPELGRCVTELRRLIHVEDYVRRGEQLLDALRQRTVKPEETVRVELPGVL
jgi:hypothetical protein